MLITPTLLPSPSRSRSRSRTTATATATATLPSRSFASASASTCSSQAALESLTTNQGHVSLVELTNQFAKLTSKSSHILGADDKASEKTLSWLAKLDSTSEDALLSPDSLKSLDADLASVTFLASHQPTAADLALFAALYPTVSKLEPAAQHAHPSLVRYVSHLSNLPVVTAAAAASGSQLGFAPFEPVYEGMPAIERKKPEDLKKEKKKNKDAVPAAKAQTAAQEAPKNENKKKEKKEKAPKEAKAGGGGGGKKGGAGAPAAADKTGPIPSQIDLRVGKIVKIEKHPDADSLYLEQVDFGEPDGPRTILSSLVHFVPIEKMQNRMVVGICNLKPVAMRGIKSYGMLLCATHKDGKDGGIEPVCPPEGSQPGDRIWVEGFEGREPEAVLNPKKKVSQTQFRMEPSTPLLSIDLCNLSRVLLCRQNRSLRPSSPTTRRPTTSTLLGSALCRVQLTPRRIRRSVCYAPRRVSATPRTLSAPPCPEHEVHAFVSLNKDKDVLARSHARSLTQIKKSCRQCFGICWLALLLLGFVDLLSVEDSKNLAQEQAQRVGVVQEREHLTRSRRRPWAFAASRHGRVSCDRGH